MNFDHPLSLATIAALALSACAARQGPGSDRLRSGVGESDGPDAPRLTEPSPRGFYVEVAAGLASLTNTDTAYFAQGDIDQTELSMDEDPVFGGTVGWAIGPEWSLELEVMQHGADASAPRSLIRGDFDWTTLMANAVFRPQTSDRVQPYIGFGAGFIPEVELDLQAFSSSSGSYASDGLFAFQALLGASVPLTRAVEAFGELKILVAQDADFTASNPSSTVDVTVDVNAKLAMFGLRIWL